MGFYIAPKKVVCIQKRSINIHQPRLPQVPIQIAKRWSLKKKQTSRGQIAIFMATNGGSTSISKVESPSHFGILGLIKLAYVVGYNNM